MEKKRVGAGHINLLGLDTIGFVTFNQQNIVQKEINIIFILAQELFTGFVNRIHPNAKL